MIEFRLLGGAVLQQGGKPLSGAAARRHPVALLALLSTAPARTLSRAKIIGLLWPDADEGTGRNRLTSTLYPLRRVLGPDAIASVGDALRLDPSTIDCDVWRFREALEAGNRAAAVELYRGPFLDGFYLEGSSLFDERVESERQSLHRSWRDAVSALAEEADGDQRSRDSVQLWQALAASDPSDSAVAGRLVRALARSGSRGDALRVAKSHIDWLREELSTEPDRDFRSLVEQVRRASPMQHRDPTAAAETEGPSIAVLPFETLGSDGESTLGEGVHSGIITRLSGLGGLSVIARTTVRRYRNTDRSASEIGAELAVRWVLEGDVQLSGPNFRVNVRLVEAASDRQVWGHEYAGALSASTFFHAQADIAEEIAQRLRVQLNPRERLRLASNPTESLEAYRLCTQGRMQLDRRSPEDMQRALRCFEEALSLDDDYAVAWVGVADALGLLHAYGYAGEEVLPRAEEAVRAALERDPDCAEAHAALGRMHGQHNRAAEAEREIRLALSLKPGYAEAHNWCCIGLQVGGDARGALRAARRAVALNPLSAEAVGNLASSLLFCGEPAEALLEAQRASAIEAGYDTAKLYQGLALYHLGRVRDAVEVLEDLVLPWAGSGAKTALALAHVAAGQSKRAREVLEQIRASAHPFDEGVVLAALAEREPAFDAFGRASFGGLEFAFSYWPTVVVRYLFPEVWDKLRDDSRYAELLIRIDRSWGFLADEDDSTARRWATSP